MNAVSWFAGQSFGATEQLVRSDSDVSAAIAEHWRARIASGQLSPAQIKVAERIIAESEAK